MSWISNTIFTVRHIVGPSFHMTNIKYTAEQLTIHQKVGSILTVRIPYVKHELRHNVKHKNLSQNTNQDSAGGGT